MKQIIIPLTEEQQSLIKLTASALDHKIASYINPILDEQESVEIDIRQLEPDGDSNQILIAIGLLVIDKIAKDLNL